MARDLRIPLAVVIPTPTEEIAMSRTQKALIVALTVALAALLGQEVYAQMRLHQLMIDKLHNAQKLLEGIVLKKFDKVEKHAEELVRISKTAEWLAAGKNPRYEQFSNDFQRAAEKVIRKAKEKNVDGVTLGYFELTQSCVRCHEYLREVRDARGPGGSNAVALAK
jgi:Zn-dependent oligopeptidase